MVEDPRQAGRIEIRGLCRSFRGEPALHPLELEVEPGRVTGLLGPNGSGKSTLLRLLLGLLRPDAGSARVDGVELAGDGIAIRRRTTYAPGEISLYGELRARDHLAWFLRGRPRAALDRSRRIAQSLELPLAQRVWAYSHGMKRQLLFAAAMGPEVRVRILDEASEGLDPNKRSVVLDLLGEDARRGTTILLSSHHLGEVDRVCSTFVFLNEGRLVSVESAAEVRRRASRLVRLRFPADLPAERRTGLLAALRAMPGVEAELRDSRAIVRLETEDPREFLAALASRRELPRPESLSFGEVSLSELYRDLYGVEAC